MGRSIFIYGLTAGVLTLLLIGLGVAVLGFDHGVAGMAWGFASMFVGLSLLFVGVRRYGAAHGGLTFGQAFGLALAIAAVAALIYVLGWEAYLGATHYSFADDYASQLLTAKIAEGGTPAELATLEADMASFKTQYANPLYRLPMTFMEIAPVALFLSLLAGLTLRTRRDDERA